MHQLGDIIMTVAIALPLGYREVPWSVCRDAYQVNQMTFARCAVFDPERALPLPSVSKTNG